MEKTNHEKDNSDICPNCRFCHQTIGTNKELVYVCRINPPSASAALISGQMGPQWVSASVWPNVTKTDWCGKFERVS